jgi:hypothetical protein
MHIHGKHRMVRSNNTIKFAGYQQPGTSRHKVTIDAGGYQITVRSDKIVYCHHCHGRFSCSGIPQEMGDYHYFKPSKTFKINYLKEYYEIVGDDE